MQPLVISDVRIVKLTTAGATISWKTNRETTGKVNWGETLSYGANGLGGEASLTTYSIDHTVEIPTLSSKTKYYFEVLATDMHNIETYDAYYSFTTP